MVDPTQITTGFALAAAIVGGLTTLAVRRARLSTSEKLKALEKDSPIAAAIVSDAVTSFNIDTSRIPKGDLIDVVRQEIETRDRRHARQMKLWITVTIVAAVVVLALGLTELFRGQKSDDIGALVASMDSNIDSGKYPPAINQANEILRRDPQNYFALSGKGEVAFYQGNFASAFDYFTQALKSQPTSRALKMNLGDTLVERGAYQDAVKLYDSISDHEPDVTYGKGRALLYDQKFEQSLEFLKTLPASYEHGKAKVLIAAALCQIAGRTSDAPMLERARQELAEALGTDRDYWDGVLSGRKADIHEGHTVTAKLLGDLYKPSPKS